MFAKYLVFTIAVGCMALANADPIPYSPVGKCPAIDPGMPVFLPDSQSCQVYYECSNGVPVRNVCPGDLEFNPTIWDCDFADVAGCSITPTEETTLEYITTTPATRTQ